MTHGVRGGGGVKRSWQAVRDTTMARLAQASNRALNLLLLALCPEHISYKDQIENVDVTVVVNVGALVASVGRVLAEAVAYEDQIKDVHGAVIRSIGRQC